MMPHDKVTSRRQSAKQKTTAPKRVGFIAQYEAHYEKCKRWYTRQRKRENASLLMLRSGLDGAEPKQDTCGGEAKSEL